MEDIKYYTPTIEEFHVEFEFEVQGLKDNEVIWQSISAKNISALTLVDRMTTRVKYLDKEDIESLGWKEGLLRINNKELHVFRYGEYVITSIFKNGNIVDISLFSTLSPLLSRVFRGTIKNKSELKRLMQQLGIYEQHNK